MLHVAEAAACMLEQHACACVPPTCTAANPHSTPCAQPRCLLIFCAVGQPPHTAFVQAHHQPLAKGRPYQAACAKTTGACSGARRRLVPTTQPSCPPPMPPSLDVRSSHQAPDTTSPAGPAHPTCWGKLYTTTTCPHVPGLCHLPNQHQHCRHHRRRRSRRSAAGPRLLITHPCWRC